MYETGSAITSTGALTAFSGAKTGRSPLDKRIVKEATSENEVWWGPVNRPMTPEVSSGSSLSFSNAFCRLSHGSLVRKIVHGTLWRDVMWYGMQIVPRPRKTLTLFSPAPCHSFGLVRITAVGTCLAIASLTAFLYMTTRYGKSIENELSTTSTPGRESMSSMALPDGMSAIESMCASCAPVPIMHSSCGTCSFVRQRKSWSTSIPTILSTMPAHSLQTATPLG